MPWLDRRNLHWNTILLYGNGKSLESQQQRAVSSMMVKTCENMSMWVFSCQIAFWKITCDTCKLTSGLCGIISLSTCLRPLDWRWHDPSGLADSTVTSGVDVATIIGSHRIEILRNFGITDLWNADDFMLSSTNCSQKVEILYHGYPWMIQSFTKLTLLGWSDLLWRFVIWNVCGLIQKAWSMVGRINPSTQGNKQIIQNPINSDDFDLICCARSSIRPGLPARSADGRVETFTPDQEVWDWGQDPAAVWISTLFVDPDDTDHSDSRKMDLPMR